MSQTSIPTPAGVISNAALPSILPPVPNINSPSVPPTPRRSLSPSLSPSISSSSEGLPDASIVSTPPTPRKTPPTPRKTPPTPRKTPRASPRASPRTRVVSCERDLEPLPMIDINFSNRNLPAAVANNTQERIEDQLMRHGYICREKIIVRNGTDEAAKYIKAASKRGSIVYILLDVDAQVGVYPSDLVMSAAQVNGSIPHSVKLGAFNCADMGTCGVAFECDGGICTVSRIESSAEPTEQNFLLRGSGSGSSLSLFPYPIVRLSDVLANNEIVLASVDKTVNRLISIGYTTCQNNLTSLTQTVNSLVGSTSTFLNQQRRIFDDLYTTLGQLHEQLRLYESCPSDPINHSRVITNIVKRNELFVEMLGFCGHVSDLSKVIGEKTHELDSINEFLSKEFSNLHSVL